jgi:hypothetical protein
LIPANSVMPGLTAPVAQPQSKTNPNNIAFFVIMRPKDTMFP